MPKISMKPVDRGPAPSGSMMFVKLAGMSLMVLMLLGFAYMMLTYSWAGERESWNWDATDVRTNFHPMLTSEEVEKRFKERKAAWEKDNPINIIPGDRTEDPPPSENRPASNGVELPFGNTPPDPELPPPDPFPSGGLTEVQRLQLERETALIEKLQAGAIFNIDDETRALLDFVHFEDGSREKTMNEFAAYKRRQAPTNEYLAMQILLKLKAGGYGDVASKLEKSGWSWATAQAALDQLRGRAFQYTGRLYDLYEITPETPILMTDGTKVEKYYEGVIALLGARALPSEHPIEHRTVMFQALTLPEDLLAHVNTSGSVSHEDKLASEHVMISVDGLFLRRWAYSREVAPYSTSARKVLTQDNPPLLLAGDVGRSDIASYELTDEMLQQVRDAIREHPVFLETEAAYYAMLAKANDPADTVQVADNIGFFDLAGDETGPRYRGQGIRVVGMIGDNYAPVILPPNISGLRRVFRTLVLHDTSDLETPKRYMLDMIDPPTGLEPRALIEFEARYYRNVFETQSTASVVRPLLIVKRVRGLSEGVGDGDWIYGVVGIGGVFILLMVLGVFIMSERRERAKFEASTLEMSRARLKKQGGLKLKPLPGAKVEKPEASDKPADPPEA